MFIEDLSPCWYLGSPYDPEGKKLKAVGWLAMGHPFTRRQIETSETRFGQLLKLLEDPWEPCCFMGAHECEFCPKENLEEFFKNGKWYEETIVSHQVVNGIEVECIEWKNPITEAHDRRHRIDRGELTVRFGATNLFVPGEGCVYIAPSMIVHYLDVHDYDPPAIFWEAVMNCPEMRSDTYRQALIFNGPSNEEWARDVRLG